MMSDNSFNAVFGGVVPTIPTPPLNINYGAFHSETTQTLILPLSDNPVNLEITDLSFGVTSTLGLINFTTSGIFQINATFQFKNVALSTNDNGYIWLQKNGVNIPFSTRIIRLINIIDISVLSYSFQLRITALMLGGFDSIQFYWSADSSDVSLSTFTSSFPDTPSVIANIIQIV